MTTSAPDGWISATLEDGVSVHIRLGRNASGEIAITDLLMSAADITTNTLRKVNPNRLLAEITVSREDVERAAAAASGDVDPTMRQAMAAIDEGGEWGWMADFLADYATADDGLTLGDLRRRARPSRPRKRGPLGRPDRSGDDRFYGRVGAAYRSASAESGRPAVVLADENNVPVETVRAWVKEARRRGHLAPGRKGRAV